MRTNRHKRLEALEALLNVIADEPSRKISEQALKFLPTEDVRLIVYGLRRVEGVLKRTPVESADCRSVLEEHLTPDELGAYRRWKDLEAEVRARW